MRWLLFLSRLAFICGICVALSISLLFYTWTREQDLVSTIIVIGFFMGIIIIPLALLSYLFLLLRKRNITAFVPLWLVISNVFFLILILIYIIVKNAQEHPWT